MKIIIFCLSILPLFYGCQDLALKEKIIDNYYLTATDVGEDCNLSYKEPDETIYGTVVGATVFAVGYNDSYMIVKQHPRSFPSPPDKGITNYYILPLKNGMDWRTKNGLIGPLTASEFKMKRKELDIPDNLTFTKVLKDLE